MFFLEFQGSEHRGDGVCERYADKKQYEGGAAGSGDPCGERASFCGGHHALSALWRREPDSGKGVQCRGYVFHLARFRDQRRLRSGHGRYRLPRLPAQEEQGAHSFRFLFSYGQGGTYFRTVSATKDKAEVRFQVNVENAGTEACDVELRTYLKDAKGKTALAFKDTRRAAGGQTVLFDRTGVVERPHLWYPIGTSGTPYLYTVENEVYVNGRLVDRQSRPWGIRQITWDEDFCYVNGEKCFCAASVTGTITGIGGCRSYGFLVERCCPDSPVRR